MARELVTNIWCDVCLSDDEETTYTHAEEFSPITLPNMKPRVIALCTEHRELYDRFRALVADLGQVVPDGQPKTPTSTRGGGTKAGVFPCPVPTCRKHTKPYKHDTSAGSHARREHGKTYLELVAEYGDPRGEGDQGEDEALFSDTTNAPVPVPSVESTECEDCGKRFEWPAYKRPTQALGVHRAKVHGVPGKKKAS